MIQESSERWNLELPVGETDRRISYYWWNGRGKPTLVEHKDIYMRGKYPNTRVAQRASKCIWGKVFCIMQFSDNICPTLVLKEPIRILINGKGREQTKTSMCCYRNVFGLNAACSPWKGSSKTREYRERRSRCSKRWSPFPYKTASCATHLGNYHCGRVLDGRNQHCMGLGADEMVRQNYQVDERKILGFRMQMDYIWNKASVGYCGSQRYMCVQKEITCMQGG